MITEFIKALYHTSDMIHSGSIVHLKVHHPRCVVKLTMCSMYVYVKTQLYLLVVY